MRRGRRERKKNPPVGSAVGPGMLGGRYRPLTRSDEEQIHQTILDVLENIGMGDPIPVVKERALERGCFMNEHDRLCFPRALVEDVIDPAIDKKIRERFPILLPKNLLSAASSRW